MSVSGITQGMLYDIQQRQLEAARQKLGRFSPMGGVSLKKEDAIIQKEVKEWLKAKEVAPQPMAEAAADIFAGEIKAFESLISTAKGFDVDSPEKQKLVNMWEGICKEGRESLEFAKKEACRKSLGQILFLLEQAPEQVKTVMGYKKDERYYITQNFNQALAALVVALNKKANDESALGIAKKDTIRDNMVSLEMAKCLYTKSGELNAGIFDDVIMAFKPANKKELERVFKTLVEKPAILNSTKAPEAQERLACAHVNFMLGRVKDHPVTDLDAKVCVLSSYLSDVALTVASSPDVASIAKLLKKVRFDCCVSDNNALLATGKMTRAISGYSEPVVFTVRGTNAALDAAIKLRTDGVFAKVNYWSNAYLWNSQGVILALRAMDVADADVQKTVLAALKKLGEEYNAKQLTTTVDEVLETIAGDDKEKLELGRLAFSCYYENGLDATWKKALISMANLRPEAQIAARILHVVQERLMLPVATSTIHQRANLAKVFEDIRNSLVDNIGDLRFDHNDDLKKIAQACLSDALEENEHLEESVKEALTQFVNSTDFAAKFGKAPNVNPLMFLQTYFGTKAGVKIADAYALLKQLVAHAKELQAKAAEELRTFIASPKIALEFAPEHGVFKAEDMDTFLLESSTVAYNSWDETVISNEDSQEIITWMKNHIYTSDDVAEFEALAKDALPRLSLKDARTYITTDLFNKLSDADAAKASHEFDNFLVSKFYETRQNLVIPFGNGAYKAGDHDVKFCFFADPIDQKLAVGMVHGNTLIRLNQTEAVDDKEWEIGDTAAV